MISSLNKKKKNWKTTTTKLKKVYGVFFVWGHYYFKKHLSRSIKYTSWSSNFQHFVNRVRTCTDFCIQNSRLFPDFSKTILYFSRLKVTKQVINRDLEKCRNQAFFTMYWKCMVTKVQCERKRVMKFLFLWLNS